MLTYLKGSTRPGISIEAHQAARFCIDPKLSHEQAVKRIGRCLLGNKDKVIVFRPYPSKGVECYVDADFANGWSQADTNNADCVLSRPGFVVFYVDCPIFWASRLQTKLSILLSQQQCVR